MERININFEISKESKELSKKLFGRDVRIIISNGILHKSNCTTNPKHYYEIENTEILYFPENNISFECMNTYVKDLCKDLDAPYRNYRNSVIIVTNNVTICTSVPKQLCRFAKIKKDEVILEEPTMQTFGGNYYTVIEMIAENSYRMPSTATEHFNKLIDLIEGGTWNDDKALKESIMNDIELVGDEILYFHLYKKLGIEKRLKVNL